MPPEVGWGDDPVQPCRCPGLQAGSFLKKSCASMQPGFGSSGEAAAALSRGRKPMDRVGLRVEPRRRRQHLPSGASPKAAAEAWDGRGCGRDARAPGGHDPSRKLIPHPPHFCKGSVVSGKSKDHAFATLLSRRGQPQPLGGASWSFVCLRGSLFCRCSLAAIRLALRP